MGRERTRTALCIPHPYYSNSTLHHTRKSFSLPQTLTMGRSPLLESFDPFAVHPFTNNSGLAPSLPQPSKYPTPLPSPRYQPSTVSTSPASTPSSSPESFTFFPSSPPSSHVYPKHPSTQPTAPASTMSPSRPVFVPFRKDTSSPDLILKKSPGSQGKAA